MATTTRLIGGGGNMATNRPNLPAVTAAASAGDVYPSLRAVSRSSINVATSGAHLTWIAQDSLVGWSQAVMQTSIAFSPGCEYIVVDPSTIDWTSITVTGPRPQNPGGGLPRFNTVLGTATITNGAVTLASASAVEDTLPILSGNTFTEARKLPPICSSSFIGVAPFESQIYSRRTITLPSGAFFIQRWLGGSITVAVANGSPTWNIIVWPLNPGTLTATFGSGVVLATVANGSTTTFTAAQLIAKGVIRWDQFVIGAGSVGIGQSVTLTMLAPLDLPPPYDCPGYDVPMLKGGYLT